MKAHWTRRAGLAAVTILAAAGVVWLAARGGAGRPPEAAGARSAPALPSWADGRNPRAREGGAAAGAGDSRVYHAPVPETAAHGTIEDGGAIAGEFARALLPVVAKQNAVRAAVAEARAGTLHPVDLEARLREIARGDPLAGTAILEELIAERSPEIALKLAQTLGELLDDQGLRRATVDALAAAPPEAREVGLLALLGRGEPEAAALAARSFLNDPPGARATAAFLLNQTPAARAGEPPPRLLNRREIFAHEIATEGYKSATAPPYYRA